MDVIAGNFLKWQDWLERAVKGFTWLIRLEMTGNGRNGLKISGNSWNGEKLLEMGGNGWEWLEQLNMTGNGQKGLEYLKMVANGWKLLEFWKWLEIVGSGKISFIFYFCCLKIAGNGDDNDDDHVKDNNAEKLNAMAL